MAPAKPERATYRGRAMREGADVIDHHRATGAACRRPAIDTRSEHEVIKNELAAALEEVEQARPAVWAVEGVIFLHLDHRQPAPLRGQLIVCSGGGLFLAQ